MTKLFLVEISTVAVVAAIDADHAHDVATAFKRDAFSDDPRPCIGVRQEVKTLDDLSDGWDGECLPYGGDGMKRIRDLLPKKAP